MLTTFERVVIFTAICGAAAYIIINKDISLNIEPAVSGTYVAENKTDLVQALTFDAQAKMATITSPLFVFTNGKMVVPYTVSSNTVYIVDPQRGSIPFIIQNRNTLVCQMKIIGDVYIKE